MFTRINQGRPNVQQQYDENITSITKEILREWIHIGWKNLCDVGLGHKHSLNFEGGMTLSGIVLIFHIIKSPG